MKSVEYFFWCRHALYRISENIQYLKPNKPVRRFALYYDAGGSGGGGDKHNQFCTISTLKII